MRTIWRLPLMGTWLNKKSSSVMIGELGCVERSGMVTGPVNILELRYTFRS